MNEIHTADCMEKLDELEENSVHAIVTDPPYGLAFMGRSWDDFEPKEYQEFCAKWSKACKRVLKPGGHLLAFSGNRTHHRLFTGVEDAGFEIRDTLTWHYGSGFPKASDIGKTIDKRSDTERTEGKRIWRGGERQGGDLANAERRGEGTTEKVIYDEPVTDAAKKWDGWKTGLKPATEYIVMARKPFEGATVDCVQKHGTGALNIEACRVETEADADLDGGATDPDSAANFNGGWHRDWMDDEEHVEQFAEEMSEKVEHAEEHGRYPANVVFDETQAEALDAKNEHTKSSGGTNPTRMEDSWTGKGMLEAGNTYTDSDNLGGLGDSGGPSRYFYTSKASKSERTENGSIDNSHPTVKPQDLMEWLVKLVTREGQLVLDPFTGSGTTLKACKNLNREFIGIEQQAKWADVARVRVGLTPNDPSVVREDDQQQGLESYE